MNVASTLLGTRVLLDTKELTGTDLTNVMNVERPFVCAQPWLCIREFILEKNPICAIGVLKALVGAQTLLNIKESTLVKSLTNVPSVGRPSARAQISLYTGESTQEKSPTCAVIVIKALASAQTW